jgi:hypothetical protein
MPARAPKHNSLIRKVLHVDGPKGNRREMLIPSLARWGKLATRNGGWRRSSDSGEQFAAWQWLPSPIAHPCVIHTERRSPSHPFGQRAAPSAGWAHDSEVWFPFSPRYVSLSWSTETWLTRRGGRRGFKPGFIPLVASQNNLRDRWGCYTLPAADASSPGEKVLRTGSHMSQTPAWWERLTRQTHQSAPLWGYVQAEAAP